MNKIKVVINRCYSGFGLSKRDLKMLGIKSHHDITRDNPRLVQIVEGNRAESSWRLCSPCSRRSNNSPRISMGRS